MRHTIPQFATNKKSPQPLQLKGFSDFPRTETVGFEPTSP
jgi:hypothetical protein